MRHMLIFAAAGLAMLAPVRALAQQPAPTQPAAAQQPVGQPGLLEEVARFPSKDARQGIAVDQNFFYAVTDRAIAKHDKRTGKLVSRWDSAKDGPIIHLDSGVIVDGKLYAAHSNYPQLPMTSSVEIYDTKSMRHVGTHSFGIQLGSLTWIDRHDGAWWAVFANYSRVFGTAQQPYGNSYWTTLVKLDDQWRQLQAWIFPASVIKRAEPMSVSGGSWGPDGLLYVTGHDHPEVYAMRLPTMGSVLELVETIPFGNAGQGIAWDRSEPGVLWGIHRAKAEALAGRLKKKCRSVAWLAAPAAAD